MNRIKRSDLLNKIPDYGQILMINNIFDLTKRNRTSLDTFPQGFTNSRSQIQRTVIKVIDFGRYTTEILSCHLSTATCGWTISDESREIHFRESHGHPPLKQRQPDIKILRGLSRLFTERGEARLTESASFKRNRGLFSPKILAAFPGDTLEKSSRLKKGSLVNGNLHPPVESFLIGRPQRVSSCFNLHILTRQWLGSSQVQVFHLFYEEYQATASNKAAAQSEKRRIRVRWNEFSMNHR